MMHSTQTVRSSRLSEFLEEGGTGTSRRPRDRAEEFSNSFERALAEGRQGRSSRTTSDASRPASTEKLLQASSSVERRFPATACGDEQLVYETAPDEGTEASPRKQQAMPGPKLTREDWTVEMLTGDLSAETLSRMKSPAAFLQARVALLRKPTSAEVVSAYNGASAPVNPTSLSTLEQAEAVRERLQELGIDAEITEAQMGAGPFNVEWNGEDRRVYRVAGLNVGLVMEKYARNTKESADRMILDQFRT